MGVQRCPRDGMPATLIVFSHNSAPLPQRVASFSLGLSEVGAVQYRIVLISYLKDTDDIALAAEDDLTRVRVDRINGNGDGTGFFRIERPTIIEI
jgi:hypothetical protein